MLLALALAALRLLLDLALLFHLAGLLFVRLAPESLLASCLHLLQPLRLLLLLLLLLYSQSDVSSCGTRDNQRVNLLRGGGSELETLDFRLGLLTAAKHTTD